MLATDTGVTDITDVGMPVHDIEAAGFALCTVSEIGDSAITLGLTPSLAGALFVMDTYCPSLLCCTTVSSPVTGSIRANGSTGSGLAVFGWVSNETMDTCGLISFETISVGI